MAYRERLAWLSLGAMALTFVPYFVIVAAAGPRDETTAGAGPLGLLALFLGVQAVIQIAGRLVLARRWREDAAVPPDERDQAIERRAVTTAYYVLIAGIIVVGCVMPFSNRGWQIVNAAVFAVALAEVTHYGIVAVSYRRQT